MGLFSGDGAGCAARIFRKYDAEVIGGLHLKMPDCIGDVKLLKKSLDKNKRVVTDAEKKINKAVKDLKGAVFVDKKHLSGKISAVITI